MAVDWASLPPDLIYRLADTVLATDDIDYYMDFRAVCRAWRASTADPKANPADPRFHPRRWVALDEVHHDDECRLFVNLATGRFVRKDMPILRKYFVVAGAGGGQLVLAERNAPHAARVLNPFTGGMIRFKAAVPSSEMEVVAHVIGSSLVLVCGKSRAIYRADPDDKYFYFPNLEETRFSVPLVWTTLVGGIYAAACEDEGTFTSRFSPVVYKIRLLVKSLFSDHFTAEEIDALDDDFIVESEGETLIVFKLLRDMKVFKLDTFTDMVHPVKDLGNRALFVSNSRCLSVDASKFPSVVGNCIYHFVTENISTLDFSVRVYSLENKSDFTLHLGTPPLTVVHLLICHASNVRASQLGREVMLASLAEQEKALGSLFGRHESDDVDDGDSDDGDDD
ncbi:hypothetical protein EJB05_42182, partial [Eragrostis curvula]